MADTEKKFPDIKQYSNGKIQNLSLSQVVDDIKEGVTYGFGGLSYPSPLRLEDQFFDNKSEASQNDDVTVLDKDWVESRFLTPLQDIPQETMFHMIKSTTHFKFRDTSIGGNFACNAPAQFNRYADIRCDDYTYPFSQDAIKNKEGALSFQTPDGQFGVIGQQMTFESVTPYNGMGRFYGESLDDGRQLIYLQFGLPKFNGLLDYITNSINYVDTVVANKGRIPTGYQVGKLIGNALMFLAFPVTAPLIWVAKMGISLVLGEKPFNYYYIEPAMHIYWGCVNQIANQFATSMGIMVPIATKSEEDPTMVATDKLVTGKAYTFSVEAIEGINRMFAPNTIPFGEVSNYIDVYALMMRQQNTINAILRESTDDKMAKSMRNTEEVQKYIFGLLGQKREAFSTVTNKYLYLYQDSLTTTLDTKIKKNPYAEKEPDTRKGAQKKDEATKKIEEKAKAKLEEEKKEQDRWSMAGITSLAKSALSNYLSDWAKSFDSTARGAGAQAVFEVQYTGQSSDSFSNSYGEIGTGEKIRSMQQAVRHTKFNITGGQTGISVLDSMTSTLVDVGNGILDSATFGLSSVVRGFIAGGYSDIPQAWQDSNTSIATVSYSMDLVAPYGHAWSRFQNIIVPLSMLLAGALPLRVGSAAYTSPFLCSIFSKSVQKIRLGMITEVSISRGTTNLGYTIDKKINALSVTFSVADFSGKITTPINASLFDTGNKFRPFYDQTSRFADYIDMIAGRDFHESDWLWPNMKKNFSNMAKGFIGAWASSTGGILNPSYLGEVVWNSPASIFFVNWSPVGQ